MIRLLENAARGLVVALWLATSAFAFLSSVPFAYEQFIAPRLVPGLVDFAEWQRGLAVAALPLTWLAVRHALRQPRARTAARVTLGLAVAAAVTLPFAPALARLTPDGWAVACAMLALAVPLGLAAVDLRSATPWPATMPQDRTGSDFAAVLAAAAMVTAAYAARTAVLGAGAKGGWTGAAAGLLVHAVFAAAIFLLLTAIRGTATARSRRAPAMEFAAVAVAIVGVFELLALGVILPTLSVRGGSRVVAAALAFTLAMGLVARGRHRRAPIADGVQTALASFVAGPVHGSSALASWLLWAGAVAGVAWGFAAASSVMDWNFVVATIGAVLTWLVALGGALALPRPSFRGPSAGWAFLACFALLAAHQFAVPAPGLAAGAVDDWTMADPSFRMLRNALRPPTPADPDFYPFLQRHTNLGRDIDVRPVDVALAPLAGAPAARRPHIFLFVVDSLRRDYLSAYDPAVDFTPAIGAFAADSVVFQHAFTRYGATGLSVPSIWVGGMILHKQYVQPFAPMNTLHKLLAHERYTRWMSWDNVVDATVPHEDEGPALDTTRAVKDFRFCETVSELVPRLPGLKASGRPTFTWALPQDIHISAITREGAKAIDGGDYGTFYAPYASRIRRLDGCFGRFVDALKRAGLYDDSVVVLTADHGDSLGEGGRWGHAYTLFPEILQVPLIVHVPAWVRGAFATDPEALAFTVDITPTLYALLGHPPTAPGAMFGRPLFWPAGEPPPPRRADGQLLASSYGSVYGWLTGEGRRLYVADGVDFRDYLFTIDGTPTGQARAVASGDRQEGQQAIKAAVEDIARFYGFASGS